MKRWSSIRITPRRMRLLKVVLMLLLGAGVSGGIFFSVKNLWASANAVAWPEIELTAIVGSYSSPVHVTHAGDDSDRLFVVEKGGTIRIVKNDTLLAQPFLDISSRVNSGPSECGMLSVAFPPTYAASGHFFVYYNTQADRIAPDDPETEPNGGCDTVIARFNVTADPDVADASEEVILAVNQPYSNHNGGQIAFGPDGYLYIGLGDGGSGGDPLNAGQTNDILLGKMLRIEVNAIGTYTVPAANPFVGNDAYRPEIWATGLRNPWRFSFDRATNDLYIGDVGQGAFEEIDYQTGTSQGGENYGWRITEGNACFNPSTNCDKNGLTLPIHDYPRTQGRSVTGGVVARPADYPRMNGIYFYADFATGRIWGLQRENAVWQNQELLHNAEISPASFGEDEAGNVYLVDFRGTIYQITDRMPAESVYLPMIARQATPTGQPGGASLVWDPRLDQRGAIFKPAQVNPGQGYWRLIRAQWFDEQESAGRHHIFAETLDAGGNRQTGIPIFISWPDGSHTVVTEAKAGETWATNFDLHSTAPAYEARPATGAPADSVDGMGMGDLALPRHRVHTSYGLTWQWAIAGEATATPTPTATLPPKATPTPTSSPTATPVATSTALPTTTPAATATPADAPQFTAINGGCVTDAHSIRLEGTVRVNGLPADGYKILYGYDLNGKGVAIITSGPNPSGYYAHILQQGDWHTWLVDEGGNRISTIISFSTQDPGSGCNVQKVDFDG